MTPLKRVLWPIALLFVSAPLWHASEITLFKKGLFITTDSFVALGLSLSFALFIQHFLSDKITAKLNDFFKWILSKKILFFVFLAALFAGLIAVNKSVLHSFLSSADEHSCYFLAECLRIKKLWVPVPEGIDFFKVVHVGARDGKWFSVYPPGWPLIWAFGLSVHLVDYLNPLMAVAAIVLFYLAARNVFGNSAALLGIVLASISPFFLFNSASYFSHPTCLLMISLFLYAYLKYTETGRKSKRLIWVVIMAAAIGYGLMTRYLTMAAVSAPFLISEFAERLKSKKLNKSDALFLILLSAFVGLVLYQNWAVTGKPLLAPNKYDKSWERLGFRSNYTPLDGIIFILARFFYLMDWLPPVLIFLFLWSFFVKRKQNRLQRLFTYGFFYPVAAYFLYYSWGGSQYGPRYYYEGILFLGLVLGDWIVSVWNQKKSAAKKFIIGVVLASIISNAYLVYKQSEFFSAVSSQRKSLFELADRTIQNKAIVFIEGHLGKRLVLTQEDAVRNHPLLNTRILYAHDLGNRNRELMTLYPDREYYRGSYNGESLEAILKKL